MAEWTPLDYFPDRLLSAVAFTAEDRDGTPADPVTVTKQAYHYALDNRLHEATNALYKGLEKIGNHPYTDSLFKQVWDILTIDEKRAYPKVFDNGKFLLRVWRSRDPTPATVENERYVEHVERLEFARLRYSSPQPRGYDDRGMIYIRYGKPDDWIIINSHVALYPNEGWMYFSPWKVVFDFVQVGGLYRLVVNPDQMIAFKNPKERGKGIAQLKETREELPLSPREINWYSDMSSYMVNVSEQWARPHAETAIVRPEKPLKFALRSARFPGQRATRLELYYGLKWAEVFGEEILKDDKQVNFELYCIVKDTNAVPVFEHHEKGSRRFAAGQQIKNQVYVNQILTELTEGPLEAWVEIRIRGQNKYMQTMVPVYIREVTDSLTVSDIELAVDIEPAHDRIVDVPFLKGDMIVKPYPFLEIPAGQDSYVYFEVSNLMFNPAGKSEYMVSYTVRSLRDGLIDKMNPFWKDRISLSSTYERQGSKRLEQEYFAIDYARLEPGAYELTIEVVDMVSGQRKRSVLLFRLTK